MNAVDDLLELLALRFPLGPKAPVAASPVTSDWRVDQA